MQEKQRKKEIKKLIMSILLMLSFITILVVPFLHKYINYVLANILFYSCIVFFSILYFKGDSPFNDEDEEYIKESKKEIFIRTYFYVIFILIGIFIMNYYKITDDWNVFIAILLGVFILTGDKYKQSIGNLLCKYIKGQGVNYNYKLSKMNYVFYLSLDAVFLSWIFGKVEYQFIFGVLALIALFINLANIFIKNKQGNGFSLALDFVLGLALTVYLIYIIPNEPLKEIIIVLISAIYGGLITLTGVAWTIRYTTINNKHATELSVKPYIYSYNSENAVTKYYNVITFCNLKKRNDPKYIGCIKNTDNGILIFDYLEYLDEKYTVKGLNIIDKNEIIFLNMEYNNEIDIEKIKIFGHDSLENIHIYKLSKNEGGFTIISEI